MPCQIEAEIGAEAANQLDPEQSAHRFGKVLVLSFAVCYLTDLLAVKKEELRNPGRDQLLQKMVPFFARDRGDRSAILFQQQRFHQCLPTHRPLAAHAVTVDDASFGIVEFQANRCRHTHSGAIDPTPQIGFIIRLGDARTQ